MFNHNNYDFEPIEVNKEKQSEHIRIASMYFACFNSDAGKKVLDSLVQQFLTKAIARPNDDLIQIGIREGRADLVRQILQQIQISKGFKDGK